MEEKKAFVNAIFGTMEAVDGAKKISKAYKNTDNKYDNLMKTSLVKVPKAMGSQNAVVSGKNSISKNQKLASEELEYIYKEARILGKHDFAIPKAIIDNFDAKNTQHIKNTIGAVKNKQYMNALHHGVRAIPGTALGAGLIAGSGIGASKLLKKLDGRDNPQNNIEYNTIGGAISAGMALNAIGSGRMLSPASKALGILAGQAAKIPSNIAKNTPVGKAVNVVGQGVKATAAQAGKTGKDVSFVGSNLEKLMDKGRTFEEAKKIVMDQQLSNIKTQNWQLGKTDPSKLQKLIDTRSGELGHAFDTVQELIGKKASSELDELCKVAGAKTDYLQNVVKNKFFKSGLESLPYYAGTAVIGHMVDKKVKRRLEYAELYRTQQEHLKSKVNQPEKIASAEAVFFKNPNVNKVFKNSLESAVEGVGRMAVPLAASTIIGRDITNSLKKIDRTPSKNTTSPDEASIQLSRKDRKSIQKLIKEQEVSKTAEELPLNNSDVAQDIIREVEKEIIGGRDRLDGEKIHIGQGIKKQFRMNPSHGMHGIHGMTE